MEEPCLSLQHHSFITPSSPSPQPSLFLSAADLLCRSVPHTRKLLFFKICPEDYPALVDKLKSSLAQVLVDFYPLAGRLATGTPHGRLEIACNDLGAEFVEAFIDGVHFSDLEGDNFDMKPFFSKLTRWADFSPDAPPLSIQVTRFKCGSIALGVALSHVLADGQSLWHFVVSWAEVARGVPISLRPVHARNLLRVDNPSHKKANVGLDYIEDDLSASKDSVASQKMFQFSREMITALKKSATIEGDDDFKALSSYEVLTAHIWKCATRARGHSRNTRVAFIHVADMRTRMQPPLPDGYFGVLVLWRMAIATVGELEDEDLARTALRMRVAVASTTSEAMEGWLHEVELNGPAMILERGSLNTARMRVSSSSKFPVYNTDFGWGKPLAVRSASVDGMGKIALYPSSKGLGSVDVCMTLPLHAMDRLVIDPTFTRNLSLPP